MKYLIFSTIVAIVAVAPGLAHADPPAGDGAGHEGFVLDLMVGLGGPVEDTDDYERRLDQFGFERDSDAFGLGSGRDLDRYVIALGRRVHEHAVAGIAFSNQDAVRYRRRNEDEDVTQHFSFTSHTVGAYVQGDFGTGHHRILDLFARVGGGLAYGSTAFDEIVIEAANADSDPAFGSSSPRTRVAHESFDGYYLDLSSGVAITPWDYFGFQFMLRYVFAPALDDETGDTHDVGGLAFMFGLRLRTWE